MARKEGFGKVVVNGEVLTTNSYKNIVKKTLLSNGNRFMSTSQIIDWAYGQRLIDERKENKYRKAHSHPLYKIMSIMSDKDKSVEYKFNRRGILEYRMKS